VVWDRKIYNTKLDPNASPFVVPAYNADGTSRQQYKDTDGRVSCYDLIRLHAQYR